MRRRRRAVGLRGFVYFVGTHTRSTVPLGRSAEALGAIIEGPQILVVCHTTRVGKGLMIWVYSHNCMVRVTVSSGDVAVHGYADVACRSHVSALYGIPVKMN